MGGGHLLTEISELVGMRMSCVVRVEHSWDFGNYQRDYLLEFPFDGKVEYVSRIATTTIGCLFGRRFLECLPGAWFNQLFWIGLTMTDQSCIKLIQ